MEKIGFFKKKTKKITDNKKNIKKNFKRYTAVDCITPKKGGMAEKKYE